VGDEVFLFFTYDRYLLTIEMIIYLFSANASNLIARKSSREISSV
jgi:hypothetical protein